MAASPRPAEAACLSWWDSCAKRGSLFTSPPSLFGGRLTFFAICASVSILSCHRQAGIPGQARPDADEMFAGMAGICRLTPLATLQQPNCNFNVSCASIDRLLVMPFVSCFGLEHHRRTCQAPTRLGDLAYIIAA